MFLAGFYLEKKIAIGLQLGPIIDLTPPKKKKLPSAELNPNFASDKGRDRHFVTFWISLTKTGAYAPSSQAASQQMRHQPPELGYGCVQRFQYSLLLFQNSNEFLQPQQPVG